MDEQAIVKAVLEGLKESEDHHNLTQEEREYVAQMLRQSKKRTETYEAIRLHVMKYGALSLLTVVLVALWHYTKEHLS